MKNAFLAITAMAAIVLLLFSGCTTPPGPPGSDRDEHGCIPSAGYSWCEEKQKCLRIWEENCTAQLVGNDSDEHGCKGSAGYSWCESKQKCLRIWEENCTMTLEEAKQIAQASECMQAGKLGNYSDYRSTSESGNFWWLSLDDVSKPGCGAACVVFETNRTAAVNWMCTGLILPIEDKAKEFCGEENTAKVYVCGDKIRVVSSLIGGGSTFYDVQGNEVTRCPVVAPDSMSVECRQLLLGNNCVETEIC